MTTVKENKMQRFIKSQLLLVLIIIFVVVVRIRLLDFPLERDEGEYAYMGQLLLQGIPPYSGAYNMKLPGTAMMYALIMSIFGQTAQGIHLGFMVVNCTTILFVFLLAKKMMSRSAALAASGTYALLSLSPSVFGFAAHATHFVVLMALGGILALLSALEKNTFKAYFGSGVLLGLAFLMKQPGVFFLLFGAIHIVYRHFSTTKEPLSKTLSNRTLFFNLGIYAAGAAVPLLVILVWIYYAGTFDRFWFWTVEYASKYAAQIPLAYAFSSFSHQFPPVVDGFLLFWAFSVLGFIVMFFPRTLKVDRVFVLLFTLLSFLSICPGFYFREHYFVTLLPAVSLLTGIFFDFLSSRGIVFYKPAVINFIGFAIFMAAALPGIIKQNGYFFKDDPVKLSRAIYGQNPFPESPRIAEFIKSRSVPTDKIAVLGSEPQIYFYSGRLSATGYIYTYSLMEKHEYALTMQKEMAHEIEVSNPKFIVLVSVYYSWLTRPKSEKFIYDWAENYIKTNYVLVGVADIISPELTVYKWDDDARKYQVKSSAYLLIFEKSTDALK